MFKVNMGNVFKLIKNEAIEHSSEILFGMGISGMWIAGALAIKATVKATGEMVERIGDKDKEEIAEMSNQEKTDLVIAVAKPYIPAVTVAALSTVCLFKSKSKDLRKNAALAAAYSISEATLEEYQNKVVETVGEKKEQAIRDDIAKDHVQQLEAITPQPEIINTGLGTTLCYDYVNARPFYSSKNAIDKIVNTLNYRLRSEMFISLNDFYYEMHLPAMKQGMGDNLGWNIDDGEIELDFSSQLYHDGTPMLVISYRVAPQWDYRTLY